MNAAPQRTGAKNLRTLASGKMAGMRVFCWRREWGTAAGLLLLLPLYGVSMPPETVFEDAGMLAAVCRDFGLPHPPGYPLYAILCAPFSHALGAMTLNPAQAAAWLSALFAAGACAMFYEICRRLSAPPWRALALALTLGAGARFWSQAVIAEVYTLNALLVAATVAMIFRLLQKPNARRFWHLCFVAGLGLSAHWPLYLAHAPVFLLLLSPILARKKMRSRLLSPKTIIGGAAILMLGLSPYLYLWLRPMFPPTLSLFPPPSNIAEVAAYIARDVYAAKDGVGGDWRQCADGALWSLRLLLTEHALLGGAMAAAGAFCFVRRRPPLTYAAAIFFGALATGPILTAMLCPNTASEFARAIFLPYPLPAMMFLLILVAELLRRLPSRACIVLTAALPLAAAANWHDNNRSDDRLASEFARAVLQSLPPDAIFVLSSDYDFPLFYHHHALGERPDIRLVRDIPKNDSAKTLSAESETESLSARRVFIFSNLILPQARLDWGMIQQLSPTEAEAREPIPPPLLEFYRRLPPPKPLLSGGREWQARLSRRGWFDVARALTILQHQRALTLEEEAILTAAVRTSEGLFGRLGAKLRGEAGDIAVGEIRDTLSLLLQLKNRFPLEWRAQLFHRQGVLDLLDGDWPSAKRHWRRAMQLDSSPDNPVLIDLLQLLAAENNWSEYRRLRKKYWMVKNPSLADFDRASRQSSAADSE